MTLDQLSVNQKAVISAVGGEGELRCRLLDMGLIPKTVVKVVKFAPMGDPMQIRLRGYELTLRKEDAKKIELLEGSVVAATASQGSGAADGEEEEN